MTDSNLISGKTEISSIILMDPASMTRGNGNSPRPAVDAFAQSFIATYATTGAVAYIMW
jgi:hypothetical protein